MSLTVGPTIPLPWLVTCPLPPPPYLGAGNQSTTAGTELLIPAVAHNSPAAGTSCGRVQRAYLKHRCACPMTLVGRLLKPFNPRPWPLPPRTSVVSCGRMQRAYLMYRCICSMVYFASPY